MAEKLPAKNGERLRHDLQIARVTPDGDFLLVDLPGYERPEYRGHHNLPFEGKMRAADGGAMSVLVNMDQNDRLLAVEFIRWESLSSVAPDWSTLTIVPEPPMGLSEW
ncbi:MAG: hypothetical protein M3Q08_12825 [Pseudomonadota bacterium]|nr:hypothetical protein [Pseudomonadota bacterium]